ncbi:MAG TPA: hypothetical protein VNK51_16790 [Bradyrhizobium sp.]|nr:hypothetical protein [Bradyrhizobium sp.]
MEKLSAAEKRALAATALPSFPIQLHEVRRTVKAILDLFGRCNFFSEYTVHDFSHVEAMLADLDWIIPDATKEAMTPADWLLITLAIYFHDLGLIVTEDEYQNRDRADFAAFATNSYSHRTTELITR